MRIRIPSLDLDFEFDPKETNPQIGDKIQLGREFYVIYKIEDDTIYCELKDD